MGCLQVTLCDVLPNALGLFVKGHAHAWGIAVPILVWVSGIVGIGLVGWYTTLEQGSCATLQGNCFGKSQFLAA